MINALSEVEAKVERENKFQLNISMIYISFIARNDKKIRREFLLGYLENIEFLVVDADEDKNI